MAENISLKLKIWRQKNGGSNGRFEIYDMPGVNTHMSFLEMLDVLNDFIKTERMCCDFFTFQITVDGEYAWLELSGPVGTKQFIQDELEL